jgi:hypothetical protein
LSVDLIRVLVGDKRKAAVNEPFGEGDGTNRRFQLDMFPLASSPTSTLAIFLTGVTAATNSYVVSGDVGRVTFNVGSEPAQDAQMVASYEYFAISSGDISNILSGLTATPYLAASRVALALAADASRFFAYTMGDKSVDKRKVAENLRLLSKDLKDTHFEVIEDQNYTATVFTFKDNSGTPFHGYDVAETVYETSGS